jgi:hypothetical protein
VSQYSLGGGDGQPASQAGRQADRQTDRNSLVLRADRARLLVTHQRQYLPHCDELLVLRGGRVVASGSYEQLLPLGLPEMTAAEGARPSKPAATTQSNGAPLAQLFYPPVDPLLDPNDLPVLPGVCTSILSGSSSLGFLPRVAGGIMSR